MHAGGVLAMRHLAWVALVVVVAGSPACVPARDNPYDPDNAPRITLAVSPLDGPANGEFTFTVTVDGATADAFAWDFDGDGAPETSGAAQMRRILPTHPEVFGEAGEGVLERNISVDVTVDGAVFRETTLARLHNRIPVVDVGPEIVTAAWSGHTVVLDICGGTVPCATFDADEAEHPTSLTTEVVWTWEQTAGIPVGGVTVGSNYSFTAPMEPGLLVFRLSGSDGFRTVTDTKRVLVGTPAWVRSGGPIRLHRIHDVQTADLPTDQSVESLWVERATGAAWIGMKEYTGGVDPGIVRRIDRNGGMVEWDLPGHTGLIYRAVGTTSAGCILSTDDVEPSIVWTVAGAGGSATAAGDLGVGFVFDVLEDGDGGACLLVSNEGIHRVREDLTTETVLVLTTSSVGWTARPADGSVWIGPSDDVAPFLRIDVSQQPAEVEVVERPAGNIKALLPDGDGVLALIGDPFGQIVGEVHRVTRAGVTVAPAADPIYVVPRPFDPTSAEDGRIWSTISTEEVLVRHVHVDGEWVRDLAVSADDVLTGLRYPVIAADFHGGGIIGAASAASTTPAMQRLPAGLRSLESVIVGMEFSQASTEGGSGNVWLLRNPDLFRVDSQGSQLATIDFDNGEQVTGFAARSSGGVVTTHVEADDGSLVLSVFDRFGSAESQIALEPEVNGSINTSIALDHAGDVVCVARSGPSTGTADLLDAAGTVIDTGAEPASAVVDREGTCWYSMGGVLKSWVPGGTPVLHAATGGALRTDGRSAGVWIYTQPAAAGRLERVDGAGTVVESMDLAQPSLDADVVAECAPGPYDPNCVTVWALAADRIYRRTVGGPPFGQEIGFTVSGGQLRIGH